MLAGVPPNPPHNCGEGSEDKHERETDAQVAKIAGESREKVRKYRKIQALGDERILEAQRLGAFSMDNAYHLARIAAECGPETYAALWELDHDEAKVRKSTPQLKHLLKLAKEGNGDEVTADLVELVESGHPDTNSGKPVASVHKAHEIRRKERRRGLGNS